MTIADKLHCAGNWLQKPELWRRVVLLVALLTMVVVWPWAAWQFRPVDVFLSVGPDRVVVEGHAGPPVLYQYRNGELMAWDWTTAREWKIPQPRQWRDLVVGAEANGHRAVVFHSPGNVVSVTSLKPPFAWTEYRLPRPPSPWRLVMISSAGKHAVFVERVGQRSEDLVVVDLPSAAVIDRFSCPYFTRVHSSTGEITLTSWIRPQFILTETKTVHLDDQGHWQDAPPRSSEHHSGAPCILCSRAKPIVLWPRSRGGCRRLVSPLTWNAA